MVTKIPIYQIDAFTGELFKGNPAAVCPLQQWLPEDIMQKIAAENNLSETAFFVGKDGRYEIRWFTPTVEVELCGHATLASAHVIFNHIMYKGAEVIFTSQSGLLSVKKKDDLLCMDFPARSLKKETAPAALLKALGNVKVKESYNSSFFMLMLGSEEEVLAVQPDMKALASVKEVPALIITAAGKNVDFVSRVFAPAAGIDEDPVTGSAHCVLIPYWAERVNKKELHATQLSKRGGEIFCGLSAGRVQISGKAITYMEGEIFLKD